MEAIDGSNATRLLRVKRVFQHPSRPPQQPGMNLFKRFLSKIRPRRKRPARANCNRPEHIPEQRRRRVRWLISLRADGTRERANRTDLILRPGSHVRIQRNRIALSCDKRHRPSMPLPRPSPVLRSSGSRQRTNVNVMPWLRRWEFDQVAGTLACRSQRWERTAQRTYLSLRLCGRRSGHRTPTATLLLLWERPWRGSGNGGDSDYDGQNMQTRKEAFLVSARSQKTDDYLRSTRSAPLGTYEIKAGWEIPAVLEQNLNSDLPGDLKALVMSNVYDTATGRYLLIPQGSRLIGRYDSRVSYGQDGVQVVWDRVMFPDASSVDINGMVGLDSHGNAGLRDKVDRHYKRLFGFAAMTSMFSAAFDLSQRQTYGSGLAYPSIGDTASASVGRELSQTGAMITRRNLNVQPTIKVPVGYKFTVRVNRDILFDAPYQPMEADPQPLVPSNPALRRRTAFTGTANQR